jgi:hypothetical protein
MAMKQWGLGLKFQLTKLTYAYMHIFILGLACFQIHKKYVEKQEENVVQL